MINSNNVIENISDSLKYIIADPLKILIGVAFMLIYLIPFDILSILFAIEKI